MNFQPQLVAAALHQAAVKESAAKLVDCQGQSCWKQLFFSSEAAEVALCQLR